MVHSTLCVGDALKECFKTLYEIHMNVAMCFGMMLTTLKVQCVSYYKVNAFIFWHFACTIWFMVNLHDLSAPILS